MASILGCGRTFLREQIGFGGNRLWPKNPLAPVAKSCLLDLIDWIKMQNLQHFARASARTGALVFSRKVPPKVPPKQHPLQWNTGFI